MIFDTLPECFLWGVATSAYQIEGAVAEGGRGPSVWDTFSHTPGRTRHGHTGDVACDHYHRWREDVELIGGLGADAYRFSLAWPRVQPDGRGVFNPEGIAFYDRLVDALCERGIAPVATLFHWDLPQPLEDVGGWLARDTAHRFADYAARMVEALGDRVALWVTLNEPFVLMSYGYAFGSHAPGQALLFGALPVAHHQLLGHGLATRALRDGGARAVGLVNNYSPARPASADPADAAAARRFDVLQNRLFTDPLLTGSYPADLGASFPGADLGEVRDGDPEVIAAPLDFLGVNYYHPTHLAAPGPDNPLGFEMVPVEGMPRTAFDWPVVPDGLRELLTALRDRYGAALPPLYITKNGCSYDDAPGQDGTVYDPERIAYLESHVAALRQAIAAGVDVRGYFVWSLLDNFEWDEGYAQRFGLVHVDYATQRRTPKSSYHWYRELLKEQR